MSETDVITHDDDSVITVRGGRSGARRAIDSLVGSLQRRNRHLRKRLRNQSSATEDAHDIPWQRNNNSETPRPSTVTDRSSTSMRPIFGSVRSATISNKRSSATVRPRISTTFEQGVNHVSGSVRSFKTTLKRQVSRLDDFGVVSRPRGQSSPIPTPGAEVDPTGRRRSDIACYRGSDLYKTRSFLSFLRRRDPHESQYEYPDSSSSSLEEEEGEEENVYEPAAAVELLPAPGRNQRKDSGTVDVPGFRRTADTGDDVLFSKSKVAQNQEFYLESLSRTALQQPRIAENATLQENFSSLQPSRHIQFASHADEDPFVDAKTAHGSERGLVSAKSQNPTTIPVTMGKSMSKVSRRGSDPDELRQITNDIRDDYIDIKGPTVKEHASTVRVVKSDSDSETEEAQRGGKTVTIAAIGSRSSSGRSVSPRTCSGEPTAHPEHSVLAEFVNDLDVVSKAHLNVSETYGYEPHGSHQHYAAKVFSRGIFFGSNYRTSRAPRIFHGSSSTAPAEQHFQAVAAEMTGQEKQLLEYVLFTNPNTVLQDSRLAKDPYDENKPILPIWKYGPVHRDTVREHRTHKRAIKAAEDARDHEQATKQALHQVDKLYEQYQGAKEVVEQESKQERTTTLGATATPPPTTAATPFLTPSRMSTPTFLEMEDRIIASGYYDLHACKANGETYWGSGEESNQDVLDHCLQDLRCREQEQEDEAPEPPRKTVIDGRSRGEETRRPLPQPTHLERLRDRFQTPMTVEHIEYASDLSDEDDSAEESAVIRPGNLTRQERGSEATLD